MDLTELICALCDNANVPKIKKKMCTKCSNEKCTANSLHFETIFDGNSFIFMVPLIKGYHSPTSRLCNWLLVSRFLQALNLFHPVFTAKIILIPTTSLLKAGKYLHRECTETHTHTHTHTHVYIYIYTGCPRRNVPDFGRVFLMLKYTDITQNTNVQI